MQNEELQAAIHALLEHVPDVSPAFEPGKTPIPASGKVVGTPEKALMIEAALDGWLTTGRFNDAGTRLLAVHARAAPPRSPFSRRGNRVLAGHPLLTPKTQKFPPLPHGNKGQSI